VTTWVRDRRGRITEGLSRQVLRHVGSALQAASVGGREKVVQMLMDAGAGVNVQGGEYGNALAAALAGGHDKIMQMLMNAGADVTFLTRFYKKS
jgi:hypothetical protein